MTKRPQRTAPHLAAERAMGGAMVREAQAAGVRLDVLDIAAALWAIPERQREAYCLRGWSVFWSEFQGFVQSTGRLPKPCPSPWRVVGERLGVVPGTAHELEAKAKASLAASLAAVAAGGLDAGDVPP